MYFFFFFQAEDGIRDVAVTGVQTCALPISTGARPGRKSTSSSTASTLAASRPSPTAKSAPSRRATMRARGRRTVVMNSRSRPAATSSRSRKVGPRLRRSLSFALSLGLTAGCALKGDVRKVELQVTALRGELAHSDSLRRSERDSILAVVAAVQQHLVAQQAYLVQLRGDMKTDLLSVQQQLVAVQELTGQSQQRLTELRTRIEERAQQPVPTLDTTAGRAG